MDETKENKLDDIEKILLKRAIDEYNNLYHAENKVKKIKDKLEKSIKILSDKTFKVYAEATYNIDVKRGLIDG